MDFTGLKWKCRSSCAFSGGSGRIHFLAFFSFQRIPVYHSLWHPSFIFKAAAAKSRQSCPTLCDPMDCSLPGFSIHGIFQARTLEWVPFPSPMHESGKWKWSHSVVSDSLQSHGLAAYQAPPSMGFSREQYWSGVPLPSLIFKASIMKMKVKLFSPVLPGFSIHEVFQARVLEWAAISFSRGSSQPRDWTQVSCIADRCFTAWTAREASIICIFKYFFNCEPLLSQSHFLWLWPIYHPFTRTLLITLDPTV